MTTRKVRVRFAPSPTGPLHIGGVRTALFNYLFAKKHGGDFILRIEDTDQTRYVEGAEEYIARSLKWAGLQYVEGPDAGGEYGPYRQSERKHLYKQYADQLIETGHAYYAFDTPEELEAMRERLKNEKSSVQQYNALTRNDMINSLTLDAQETEARISRGDSYVIRFKMPADETIETHDIIRGNVSIHSAEVDDKVLYKSDGMPTYHLANVVDDYLMQITHVVRGEEWLPSLPLHFLLYRSFGWEAQRPEFAHLPLILKPQGKGKLSKRDGDQMGFPVFPLEWTDPKTGEIASGYRESGYFADAFVNILALLGWNPGGEQEILTMDELAAAFDLAKVGKSGSKFDPEKARWFNQKYLQQKTNEEITTLFADILKSKGVEAEYSTIEKICSLVKDRATFVHDIWEHAFFFFEAPTAFDEKVVKKQWKPDTAQLLTAAKDVLAQSNSFESLHLEETLKEWLTQKEIGMGKVMTPLRLCMVGQSAGPHLFDILEVLGKDEVLARIDYAINKLQS